MKEFNKALGNFITDVASGGAIRHLADQGYSISEIGNMLDYPMSKEKIAQIMWEHFTNTGKILLEAPGDIHEKASFIKEQDEFGRISFRKVTETVDNSKKKYRKCEFGKALYQSKADFKAGLQQLSEKDREYIELMPWPLNPVYHEMDDRMTRIAKVFKEMD